MNPTPAGVTAPATPLVDVLHTLRLPRAPRDTHYLHRLVEAVTEGHDRSLWASPRQGALIIRAPHLDEALLPDGAAITTTTAPVPSDHSCVAWALVANPTKSTPTPIGADGTRPKGRRYPIPEEQVPGWACRKLIGPLLDVSVASADKLPSLPGHNPKTGHRITHTRYAIHGTATVADREALADLLAAGVGPGKAFGCGLLIVKEAP